MYSIYRKNKKNHQNESELVTRVEGQAQFPPHHIVQRVIDQGNISEPGVYHVAFTNRCWNKMFSFKVKRQGDKLVLG